MRYVHDHDPGIRRERRGKAFAYRDSRGRPVTDPATVARIRHLAIPPAWENVWICSDPAGHIQATGRDARGRKQFRYHEEWRERRDEDKFHRMIAFGRALPRIRRAVARDLGRPRLDQRKVIATVVRLLETTLIRVGNEEYARANHSFGLTTMRRRHAAVRGGVVHFHFRGKSGKEHDIDLPDPHLSRILRRLQDLPGQELFHFVDGAGKVRRVGSSDVNAYLHEIAGSRFSAKDFRTWAGTVLAAVALREFQQFDTHAQARRNLVAAIAHVAQRLGNTPAICRKSYIHPAILTSYLDGLTIRRLETKAADALRGGARHFTGEEGAVLAFLEQRLRQSAGRKRPEGTSRLHKGDRPRVTVVHARA